MNKEKKTIRVQIAQGDEGWWDGKKLVPFKDLSNEHLQNAKLHAQKKELYHHNCYNVFSELVCKLDAEGKKRSVELRDYNTQFHKNERKLKRLIESG